jgi:ATP-dependent Clp protease protease subunit
MAASALSMRASRRRSGAVSRTSFATLAVESTRGSRFVCIPLTAARGRARPARARLGSQIETPGHAFERAGHVALPVPQHDPRMNRHEEPRDDHTPAGREPSPLLLRELARSRTVLVFGEVTTELAEVTVAQLVALAGRSDEPIRVVLHSQGGHVEAGDTIHDVIRFIRPEVVMIGTGWVASAGALIYTAAEKKNRLALPNTRFLLHQPLGGIRGCADDIEIETAQILRMRDRLNRIFSDATGQPLAKIAADTERNCWMTAEEARTYGLVGRVVESAGQV